MLKSVVGVALTLAGCGGGAPSGVATSSVVPSPTHTSAATATARATPTIEPALFRTQLFAAITEQPVSDDVATELQSILDDLAGEAGLSATVMSVHGTWSGATGKADGVRDLRVDDQFAIASVTKSLVAAQVMQMVEAGEFGLDDPAANHLPPDLDFDANGATIRQLLSHRSGLPGYDPALFDPGIQESPSDDRRRVWTPAEMLGMVLPNRAPAGATFEYSNTNYLLLGLVIEQVRGRPIAEVLREGILRIDGVERLIYQPGEVPTGPMAMPFGKSTDVLEAGGGYLPSLAGSSVDGAAAAMASDAPSLARWWRAFCAGQIVSKASLSEMTTMHDGYGIGLYEPDPPGTVGHGGEHIGYSSLAGCVPEHGVVFVILSNHDGVDLSAIAGPLVNAAR